MKTKSNPESRASGDALVLLLLLLVVIVLLTLAIPQLTRARFTGHMDTTVQVHVSDQVTGKPIPCKVSITLSGNLPISRETTTTNGVHTMLIPFRAQGVAKGPFKLWIRNEMLVIQAEGYPPWKKPLRDLLGSSIEYDKTPPALACRVQLKKEPTTTPAPQ